MVSTLTEKTYGTEHAEEASEDSLMAWGRTPINKRRAGSTTPITYA